MEADDGGSKGDDDAPAAGSTDDEDESEPDDGEDADDPDEDANGGDSGDDDSMDDESMDEALQVEVSDGALAGKRDGETYAFLGIPYAAPPVGELRFAAPAPVEAWEGARDATQFGKRCAQLESTTLQNAGSENEDCLYLNVWTPDLSPEKKKPVMVWIHGGGNVNGSASEPLPFLNTGLFYSGRPLSETQDVVVVTFNYRLGALGFLHDDALELPGNQGLRDQQTVLAWVRDNIAAFGGDAERVTIFGESAGSFDVCLHVASPASRGLFHRAISQSGGCTTRAQLARR